MRPDLLNEIRRLNYVYAEDDDSITAAAPCPTAAHRPEKVAPAYVVTFACPHGESTHVFCAPCTADRREGVFSCSGWIKPGRNPHPGCPGSRVITAATFVPTTKSKASP